MGLKWKPAVSGGLMSDHQDQSPVVWPVAERAVQLTRSGAFLSLGRRPRAWLALLPSSSLLETLQFLRVFRLHQWMRHWTRACMYRNGKRTPTIVSSHRFLQLATVFHKQDKGGLPLHFFFQNSGKENNKWGYLCIFLFLHISHALKYLAHSLDQLIVCTPTFQGRLSQPKCRRGCDTMIPIDINTQAKPCHLQKYSCLAWAANREALDARCYPYKLVNTAPNRSVGECTEIVNQRFSNESLSSLRLLIIASTLVLIQKTVQLLLIGVEPTLSNTSHDRSQA